MSDYDFDALFEEKKKTEFGCILFDLCDAGNGKMIPMLGKGWASVGGERAQRMNDVKDLDRHVIWLTNLDRNIFWKSGAIKIKNLRESGYLQTEMNQIMREMGSTPKKVMTANSCEIASEVFSRTMMWGMSHYGIDQLSEQEWIDELKPLLTIPDQSISLQVDEALRRSYTDYIPCVINHPITDGRLITLKRPRILHAKQVLDTAIPAGNWSFIAPENLPEEYHRFDTLWAMEKPMLVKVALKGFSERCPTYVPPLLQLGESLGEGGKKKERDWMTLQEVRYFSRYAKIDIKAAFVAEQWDEFHGGKKILESGALSEFSMSLGLLAEAHWMSLSGRSRNPATHSKSLVSPRASWMRATDRFLCFNSALVLAEKGLKVMSYGGGAVSVLVKADQMELLKEYASEAGLLVPASIF